MHVMIALDNEADYLYYLVDVFILPWYVCVFNFPLLVSFFFPSKHRVEVSVVKESQEKHSYASHFPVGKIIRRQTSNLSTLAHVYKESANQPCFQSHGL